MIFFRTTNSYTAPRLILAAAIALAVFFPLVLHAESSPAARCTILISMKIKPYAETVEGIKAYFQTHPAIDTDYYYLEDVKESWNEDILGQVDQYAHRAVIAIGPEAGGFVREQSMDQDVYRIFSMILNHSVVAISDPPACGIFLSIDAGDQLKSLREAAPEIKSLGILHDPANNSDYLEKAGKIGPDLGFDIVPLAVDSKNEVPAILRQNWPRLDSLLLIPDATVISSSLVQFIIKDGISNGVPVIGYNRFFLRSGALISFVYDYKKIGEDTAAYTQRLINGSVTCKTERASFKTLVNERIAKQLDVQINDTFFHTQGEGP